MKTSQVYLNNDMTDPGRRIFIEKLLGFYAQPLTKIVGGIVFTTQARAMDSINNNLQGIDFSSVRDKRPDVRFSHIFGKQNIEVIHNELKILHKKGTYGPNSGSGFIYELDRQLDSASLTYDVRFESAEKSGLLDYGRGGKLPGFSGGNAPRGGMNRDNGFSTRLMWRENGRLVAYLYHTDNKEMYGTDIQGDNSFRFTPGKHYTIEQILTLNIPGESNGKILIKVNGKNIIESSGIRFRDTADIKIDAIMFSNFLGGHDAKWASQTDFFTHFKNFKFLDLTR